MYSGPAQIIRESDWSERCPCHVTAVCPIYNWRAGASQPSRTTGTIFLYYIYTVNPVYLTLLNFNVFLKTCVLTFIIITISQCVLVRKHTVPKRASVCRKICF